VSWLARITVQGQCAAKRKIRTMGADTYLQPYVEWRLSLDPGTALVVDGAVLPHIL
jgi:hypothetical protein